MSKHIFWINSYPKSGNTLIRAILASLFFSKDGNFNFKIIKHISQFEMSERLNFIKDINQEDFMKLNNIIVLSKYWKSAQTKENLNVKGDFLFLKSHSCLASINKNFFTSEDVTKGYIYIIRDPRDVAVSWSKFANCSIDKSIEFLTDSYSSIQWGNKGKFNKVPKNIIPKVFVSSWVQHVKSWTNNNFEVPKLFIKYEDLIDDKEKIIHKIKSFFELNFNINIQDFNLKLKNIIDTTSFKKMRKMEIAYGFDEARKWESFFRKGTKNQWKDKLTKEQISKIENNFREYMIKFNYEVR